MNCYRGNSKCPFSEELVIAADTYQETMEKYEKFPTELKSWCEEHKQDFLQLTYFDATRLFLTDFSEELGLFTNVTHLYLQDNLLFCLSPAFTQLTELTYLNLSRNKFEVFPKEIFSLSKLQRLSMDSNQLATIPSEIGNLTELFEIYLGYNQLTTLPQEIGNLKRLAALDCSGNPIYSLPQELLAIRPLIHGLPLFFQLPLEFSAL